MMVAKPGQVKPVETMVLEIRIIGPDADSVRAALLEIQAAMGSGLASNVRPSKIMAGARAAEWKGFAQSSERIPTLGRSNQLQYGPARIHSY